MASTRSCNLRCPFHRCRFHTFRFFVRVDKNNSGASSAPHPTSTSRGNVQKQSRFLGGQSTESRRRLNDLIFNSYRKPNRLESGQLSRSICCRNNVGTLSRTLRKPSSPPSSSVFPGAVQLQLTIAVIDRQPQNDNFISPTLPGKPSDGAFRTSRFFRVHRPSVASSDVGWSHGVASFLTFASLQITWRFVLARSTPAIGAKPRSARKAPRTVAAVESCRAPTRIEGIEEFQTAEQLAFCGSSSCSHRNVIIGLFKEHLMIGWDFLSESWP